jgi:hypothetical protein
MQQFVSFCIGSVIGLGLGYITCIFMDWLKIRKYQKKDKK